MFKNEAEKVSFLGLWWSQDSGMRNVRIASCESRASSTCPDRLYFLALRGLPLVAIVLTGFKQRSAYPTVASTEHLR
jgi:hypothetical protein